MIAPFLAKKDEKIAFSGYADAYGKQITAVEFSLDNGKNWARFDTSDSNPELLVRWEYSFVPTEVGEHCLMVRSVDEDGAVSPLCALAHFTVN